MTVKVDLDKDIKIYDPHQYRVFMSERMGKLSSLVIKGLLEQNLKVSVAEDVLAFMMKKRFKYTPINPGNFLLKVCGTEEDVNNIFLKNNDGYRTHLNPELFENKISSGIAPYSWEVWLKEPSVFDSIDYFVERIREKMDLRDHMKGDLSWENFPKLPTVDLTFDITNRY